MNERVRKLADEAAKLTDFERTELVDEILACLPQTDPDVEAARISECRRRLEAFDRGELASVSADEALAKHLAP